MSLLFLIFLTTPVSHAQTPILVTTNADEFGTGADCSLREAIQVANTGAAFGGCTGTAPFMIELDPNLSPYQISIAPDGTPDDNADGDFDIGQSVTIDGQGATVDANNIDRVFDIDPNATNTLDIIFTNITIERGNVNGDGGAIRITNAENVTISASTLSNNLVTGGSALGGAIFARSGGNINLTIVDSTIDTNTAARFGGGIYARANNPGNTIVNISRSAIINNIAQAGDGGGIRNHDRSQLIVANSTFSNNRAEGAGNEGGAIANINGGTVGLVNTTIFNNFAQQAGGGIQNDGAAGDFGIANSIIASNTPQDCNGFNTSGGNNIDSGNSCAFGGPGDQINTDPLLEPLANNGGPTLTHALQPNSPAIDAANDTTCASAQVGNVDQRSATRPFDVPGFGSGSTCDIGAYEFNRLPGIQIDDPSVVEGNAGTKSLTFTVSLTDTIGADVTVDFTVSDGTATTADNDYVALAPGTLTFPANSTAPQTIVVTVNGDTNIEADETLTVDLANPTWAFIADNQGTGTINDDDNVVTPVVSISGPVSVTEGNTGTINATFDVSLSLASTTPITVFFSTADGTATGGTDYTVFTNEPLVIPANTTNATINIPVNGDTVDEPNETFTVTLVSATGATVSAAQNQATGTIIDDDSAAAQPTVSISSVSLNEGNSGTTTVTVEVTLSGPSASTVTVDYSTSDGTATAGQDYEAASGTITFPPNTTSQTITINITGDTTPEANEDFKITLSNPVNATIDTGEGIITIMNDDNDDSTNPEKGDSSNDDNDDDDGGSSAPPPPPASSSAPPAAAAPPAQESSLPVAMLPETGLSPAARPWWPIAIVIGVGSLATLTWVFRRRREQDAK